jgi:hypothetical protein
MGIEGADKQLAEILAKSFIFYKGDKIAIAETAKSYIEKWKRLRETLYDMIFCSIDDFSLQTMLKHALRYLIESADENIQLRREDWKLTEEEVIRKIGGHPDARDIYRRMQLKDLYECLSLVWIKGSGALEYIENEQNQQKLKKLSEDVLHIRVIPNYYVDKRQRGIKRPFVFFNKVYQLERCSLEEPALLIGFFTPDNVNFVLKVKDIKKKFINKQLKEELIYRVREEIPDHFSLYKVKVVTPQNRYPQIKLEKRIK